MILIKLKTPLLFIQVKIDNICFNLMLVVSKSIDPFLSVLCTLYCVYATVIFAPTADLFGLKLPQFDSFSGHDCCIFLCLMFLSKLNNVVTCWIFLAFLPGCVFSVFALSCQMPCVHFVYKVCLKFSSGSLSTD